MSLARCVGKADPEGPEVREQLKRAWLAYFKQTPHMLRRLVTLSQPVRVAGVPAGLIDEVRAELLAQPAAGGAELNAPPGGPSVAAESPPTRQP